MLKKTMTILALFIFSGFCLVVWRENPARASETEPGIITVTGDAEVRVIPDEVILTFGIETWNENLNKAKQQNDMQAEAVINAIQRLGVEARHIQTDHISVQPVYDDYNRLGQDGYYVRKSIVVTLKDLSIFEELLTTAVESGANNVHGVQFRTTELRRHRDKARELAVKAAQEKAVAMAGALGQKAGKARAINENNINWWSSYNSWWGGHGGMMTQNVIQEIGSNTYAEETMAPGQITVRAQVNVSFELE